MQKSNLISKGTTIIKMGGTLLDRKKFPQLARGLLPYLRKSRTVIVHGGGKEVTNLSDRLGIKNRFLQGRRFTDQETMEVVEMTLSGKLNPYLTSQLNALGVSAIGLSGRSGRIVRAKQIKLLGRVGQPQQVSPKLIESILSLGFLPVFASIAEDQNGEPLNINADEFAASLAIAMKVKRLVLFTDVPGILDQSGKTIVRISLVDAQNLIKKEIISGGMIPKVKSALAALKGGVREVWILEGKLPLNRAKGTFISQGSVLLPKNPFTR